MQIKYQVCSPFKHWHKIAVADQKAGMVPSHVLSAYCLPL